MQAIPGGTGETLPRTTSGVLCVRGSLPSSSRWSRKVPLARASCSAPSPPVHKTGTLRRLRPALPLMFSEGEILPPAGPVPRPSRIPHACCLTVLKHPHPPRGGGRRAERATGEGSAQPKHTPLPPMLRMVDLSRKGRGLPHSPFAIRHSRFTPSRLAFVTACAHNAAQKMYAPQ